MESTINQIEKIMSDNSGKIFSINDFYNLATKNTIKSILRRLANENKITRLIDGLYTKPKYSNILKEYSYPDALAIAQKIADKFSWNIVSYGQAALNYVGLSAQVPNEYIYISDGPYRKYEYRNKTIIFKRSINKNLTFYSKKFNILIQAIKALGQNNITSDDITKLSIFTQGLKKDFKKDIFKLPFWIQEVIAKIRKVNYE